MANANLPVGMTEIPVLLNEAGPVIADVGVNQTVVVNNNKFERFSGSHNQDVKSWLQSCGIVADANGWNTHALLLRHVPTALEGTALKWYSQRVAAEGRFNNWDEFEREITRAFGSANESMTAYTRLQNRVQTAGEPVLTYLFDKLELCTRYENMMTERQKVEHIVSGLNPDYIECAYEKDIPNVAALQLALKRKEAALARKASQKKLYEIGLHYAEEGRRRRQERREQCQARNEDHPDVRGLCHFCHKSGHYARDCFAKEEYMKRTGRGGDARNNTHPKNIAQGERRY